MSTSPPKPTVPSSSSSRPGHRITLAEANRLCFPTAMGHRNPGVSNLYVKRIPKIVRPVCAAIATYFGKALK